MKNPKPVLGKIVRYLKGKATYMIHKNVNPDFKWQRSYYEHVIRNEKDLESVRRYIHYNYINWENDDEFKE